MHFKIMAYSRPAADIINKVPCDIPWELGPGASTLSFNGGYALNISSIGTYNFSTISQNTSQLMSTSLDILTLSSSAQSSNFYVKCITQPTGDTFTLQYEPNPPRALGMIMTESGISNAAATDITKFPPQIGYGDGVLTANGSPFINLPQSFSTELASCRVALEVATLNAPIKLQGNAVFNVTQYCDVIYSPAPTSNPTIASNTHSRYSNLGPILGGTLGGSVLLAFIVFRCLRSIYPQVNSGSSTNNLKNTV